MKTTEIDPKEIKLIKNDFIRLSERRFSRMESSLSPVQADKLKLIPLLFHVNHALLPGYIDKFTPCGIPNYNPSHLEKKIAKTVSQGFEYKARAHLKYRIASLFLMGSMGTLGQSNSSDIDLWICLDERIDSKLVEKLIAKAKKIKHWLAEFGVELNSYIVNHDEFSTKKSRKIESDNCGNTQNYLLLDEFYRTAVWFAGRWPLWWIIPNEENYSDYSKRLLTQKHIDEADWIDFGEVKEIPATEYFSAALWQLYKAIESPYKSSVKLLVLEVYAKLFPCGGVLSESFKQQVYSQSSNLEDLDPYLLILKFAEDALVDNPQRLEYLRRSFYLKANMKVSLNKNKTKRWQYQTVKNLVNDWGWNQERLDYLNSRHLWSIKIVIEERKNLVRELTNSYHFLSNFSRVHGVINRESKNELLSLGRKLYSAFERRSGKVDILNNGIAKDIYEPSITINEVTTGKWQLYIGHINKNKLAINSVIHTLPSLFELLFWGCANGLVTSETRLHIFQSGNYLNHRMASELVRDIEALLEKTNQLANANQYESEAKIIHIGIYINTRIDPLAEEKTNNLYRIASSSDCLSWAENKTNLANHFDVVIFNSWGEYTTKHYSGEFSWIELYQQYSEVISECFDEMPIFCRGLVQKDQIVLRVKELLGKWKSLVANSYRTHQAHRYILAVASKWQIIDLYRDKVNFKSYSSLPKLYDGLSENAYSELPEVKIKFTLDSFMSFSGFFKNILKRRFSDSLDFFAFQKQTKTIEVIIRSSNGAIHFQSHKNISISQVIDHYQQFFEKIQNRNLLNNGLLEAISYFQYIEQTPNTDGKVKSINLQLNNDFSLVQAIATQKHVYSAGFDLHTANSSYLYSEHGEGVYAKLRSEITSLRKGTGNYPIFLTDIDLSAIEDKVSIVDSLVYKKSIEKKLNRAR